MEMVRADNFRKLEDPKYFEVLAGFRNNEISRSYYYYIADRLREWGFIEEKGRLKHKIFIPFSRSAESISLEDGFVGIFNGKLVYVFCEHTSCSRCPDLSSCVGALKLVNSEVEVRIDEPIVGRAWREVIEALKEKGLESRYFSITP